MADLSILHALLLALLQGLTEWLPVSSSGHLVIAQHALGIPDIPVAFDLLLHLGTLLAVVIVFRSRLASMVLSLLRWPTAARISGWRDAYHADPDRRLALYLVVATVPAAVAGVLLQDQVEASFSSLTIVGIGLVAVGLLMGSTRWAKPRPSSRLRFVDAVVIGLAQCLSLIRGMSRSGTTISAGLWMGLERKQAAEFSFLMSIPVFLGASVLEAGELARLPELGWPQVLVGFGVSAVVGYASLRFLVGFVARRGLRGFDIYCIGAGAAVLLWVAFA